MCSVCKSGCVWEIMPIEFSITADFFCCLRWLSTRFLYIEFSDAFPYFFLFSYTIFVCEAIKTRSVENNKLEKCEILREMKEINSGECENVLNEISMLFCVFVSVWCGVEFLRFPHCNWSKNLSRFECIDSLRRRRKEAKVNEQDLRGKWQEDQPVYAEVR